jgi:multicomponent Na+:H+ antiporter subunit A
MLPMLARVLGKRVYLLAAGVPAVVVVWAAWMAPRVDDGEVVSQSVTWVPALGLDFDLRLDGFGLLFLFLIGGIGALVFAYSRWYMPDRPDNGRIAGILVGFAGAMVGIVLADNLLALFVFWELTSITSFLLIGTDDTKADARSAALQALLTTGAGGLAMLAGFVLVGQAAGTYSMSAILADPPTGFVVDVALVLVLLGALTKSAQAPFHTWLPGAMAAPTPISAYLHSATMVKAGVYLIARFSPVFAEAAPWRPIVVSAGLASLLIGGYRALRQHDLKLLLAFGTISQLGLLVVLFGLGTPEATFAGCALLVAHGIFKAGLFLAVGVIDHEAGTRDIRSLHPLARHWPTITALSAICAASMAGIPPMLGFIAKEEALDSVVAPGVPARWLLALLVVLGSMLTVAYSARFQWGAFFGGWHDPLRSTQSIDPPHRPPRGLTAPIALLAALTVLGGLVPLSFDWLVVGAASALQLVDDAYLALWHGLTLALGLSAVVLVGGLALFVGRLTVERAQARLHIRASADRAYQAALSGLLRSAADVTAVVQNGSLPVYLSIILLTIVALPGTALVVDPVIPDSWTFATSPLQVVLAIITVTAAIAACRSRRRFTAVLFIGAVGYGMSALFVLHGAPDLALTQLLIETLGIVVFMLVLRRLPDEFPVRKVRASRYVAVGISASVAAFVFVFSLMATSSRRAQPISDEFVTRAVPEAGGSNVVNVILVDFRALDTLGEVTVLAVAAVGAMMLVRGRRTAPDTADQQPPEGARSTTPGEREP